MMRILKVGSWNKGFTLIELVVVIFLIGIVLSLTYPRIQDALLRDRLKTAARRMIGTIKEIKNNAVREQGPSAPFRPSGGSKGLASKFGCICRVRHTLGDALMGARQHNQRLAEQCSVFERERGEARERVLSR